MSVVTSERNASKRLRISLSPSTRHARCGTAKPARACGPRSASSKLGPKSDAPGARGPEEIAVIAELLSLPNATEQFNLTPQRKRETLFDAFIHQLEAIARRGPVLIIFEDAHWIDPTTRELLEIIVDRVSRMSVLLVTSRDSSLLSFCSGVSSRASPAARSSCATNG